jgi:hypothetical protein
LYIFSEELESMREKGWISKKNKVYQLTINHQQYQVICPVKMENDVAVGVYLPSFKSPYRPYPCYVYLFSIALHLNGLSMRKSAKETGKKFGISKFSHSTISRVLKVLLNKSKELLTIHVAEKIAVNEEVETEKPALENNDVANSAKDVLANSSQKQLSYPGKSAAVNLKQDKNSDVEKKIHLYAILQPILHAPKSGIKLVYKYFIKYGTLLI